LEALKVFSYNYWSGFSGTDDSPENYSIISFTLFNQDDHTILKLKQLPTKVRCCRHSHHLSSFMDRSLPLPKNLPLLMVRFPPIYLHSSINLLHQHQAHYLVRQGHAPKAQLLLGALKHSGSKTRAPANNKSHVAAPIRG
jgi:hypothetical protein